MAAIKVSESMVKTELELRLKHEAEEAAEEQAYADERKKDLQAGDSVIAKKTQGARCLTRAKQG